MKVVLFCGGQGMRMRDYSDVIPKPMVPIGYRPILWHLMKYYAHYGHKQFVLCLGYRGDSIKEYFLNYNECVSNDFVLSGGGRKVDLISRDIDDDWEITFVDTGLTANIGQRLTKVRKYVQDDETFMANYADGLTDLPLTTLTDYFERGKKTACFLGVRPMASYHMISAESDGVVTDVQSTASSGRINGGFFVFRNTIFDYIGEGEELVEQPFQRLIRKRELLTYSYDGFWACMDTFKEKQHLDEVYARGDAPWELWRRG